MKKFTARATFVTYAEIVIEAEDQERAYEIADVLDGAEFTELAEQPGWEIEISPVEN
ncbi:MAG: hypothetical protein GXP04_00650 [Alphaproteobacteria bacterium]|nr:hypothetical protein [Alphaproteobacteria bacterium]